MLLNFYRCRKTRDVLDAIHSHVEFVNSKPHFQFFFPFMSCFLSCYFFSVSFVFWRVRYSCNSLSGIDSNICLLSCSFAPFKLGLIRILGYEFQVFILHLWCIFVTIYAENIMIEYWCIHGLVVQQCCVT